MTGRLQNRRKLSVSEFKGTVYVGVREFYEKVGADGGVRRGRVAAA